MIDEKTLSWLNELAERKISGADPDPWLIINPTPAKELVRLARIGLWADRFRCDIELALKRESALHSAKFDGRDYTSEALDAMPKEEEHDQAQG